MNPPFPFSLQEKLMPFIFDCKKNKKKYFNFNIYIKNI